MVGLLRMGNYQSHGTVTPTYRPHTISRCSSIWLHMLYWMLIQGMWLCKEIKLLLSGMSVDKL